MRYFFIFFLPAIILASEKHGAHGPAALIWPAINFIMVFGFIIWKIKKPLSKWFDTQALKVKDAHEQAQLKEKEANIKWDMYKKRLANLSTEALSIAQTSEKDLKGFEQRQKLETKGKIERLQVDAQNMIQHEKNKVLNRINEEIVNEIIGKARLQISSDGEIRRKVSSKMMQQI